MSAEHANASITRTAAGCISLQTAAVKAADAINAIEGVPVSDYAKTLSACWARGEITDQQMKSALLASHRKLAAMVRSRV